MGKTRRKSDKFNRDREDFEERKPRGKNRNNGRLCKICGQSAYPNYYFCPACHYKVSDSGFDDEYIESPLQ